MAEPSDYRPWLLKRIYTAAEQHDRDVAEGRIVEVAPGRFQMTGQIFSPEQSGGTA